MWVAEGPSSCQAGCRLVAHLLASCEACRSGIVLVALEQAGGGCRHAAPGSTEREADDGDGRLPLLPLVLSVVLAAMAVCRLSFHSRHCAVRGACYCKFHLVRVSHKGRCRLHTRTRWVKVEYKVGGEEQVSRASLLDTRSGTRSQSVNVRHVIAGPG